MSEVIKGNSPINNIIIEGTVEISNKIIGLDDVKPEKEPSEGKAEKEDGEEALEEEEEERFTVNYEELEALREQYRKEGEEQVKYLVQRSEQELANARGEADDILKKARTEAASVLAQADKDAEYNKEQATKDGYSQGFEEGMQKGMEDGYTAGVKKCKETMEDLKRLYAEYGREKDGLMAENRRAIFDLSLSIAEKITMTAFTQKSKNTLEKMISSAAKEFRKAKNIRVTMSKLDITEDFIADSEVLQKCFPQTANVEYELLDNAERGTLMVEGDSEILDAGVSTQLKMIEELGRGKFREKEPDQVTEAISDTAENVAAAEQEKPKKRRQSAAGANAAEPAVKPAAETVPEAAAEPASEPVIEPDYESVQAASQVIGEENQAGAPDLAQAASEIAAEDVSAAASEIVPDSITASEEAASLQEATETAAATETAPAPEAPIAPEAAEKIAPKSDKSKASDDYEKDPSDLSADELAAAVDSLLADAGIDMDDLDSDSQEKANDDVITFTKDPPKTE